MKKLLTFIFAAALFAACSDDNDDYKYEIDWPQSDFIEFGATTEYEVQQSGYKKITAEAPQGWTVTVSSGKVAVKAPAENDSAAVTSGTVKLSSNEGDAPLAVSMNVNTGIVVGFEDVPQNILAVDTYGSNFDDGYDGQYIEYTDPKSGLYFNLNSPSPYGFGSGGSIFSTWNNMEDGTPKNQCSVNYIDSKTGLGGHNGSKVFGVVFHASYVGPTSFEFENNSQYFIDHFWIMNSTYTANSIKKGDDYSNALTYDNKGYFYLTITGYNKSGSKTGSVDFYLADFRTADSPGIIEEWTKVDISSLGEVNRIEFTMDGSDKTDIWLNTPAYFCFDDIAIRK